MQLNAHERLVQHVALLATLPGDLFYYTDGIGGKPTGWRQGFHSNFTGRCIPRSAPGSLSVGRILNIQ